MQGTTTRTGIVALVAALVGVLGASEATQTPTRVVAIGDIHGAGGHFRALLESTSLIDADGAWTGGDATLVQTGDFTDRGPRVRAVIDLLMRLEDEATAAGGQVHVLLGNHEAMNVLVDVRDVTPDIFASFVDPADATAAETRRADAYRAYDAWVAARTEALGHPLADRQTREQWMTAHPIGFLEYVDAVGPEGRYGRWLRARPIAARVGDTVFVHGGFHPDRAGSVDAINAQGRREIEQYDRLRRDLVRRGVILPFATFNETLRATLLELQAWTTRLFPGPPAPGHDIELSPADRAHVEALIELLGAGSWSLLDGDGPLWFRGFARWSDAEGTSALPRLLARVGARRLVVGHTVTPARQVVARFDGRVFLIDTGMLVSAYQGRASALELVGPRATAVYLDRRDVLIEPTP